MTGFAVRSLVLRQQDQELYCFVMDSEALRRIAYVSPRWANNPEEVQRLLTTRRARQIGAFLQQPGSLLPNAIVVSLSKDVSVEPGASPETRILRFPAEEGRFAYVLDGQHRLEGFRYSNGVHLELPVVALHDADARLRGKIFADINSKQVRVSDVHLLSLYHQLDDLPADQLRTVDIVRRLGREPDSPLRSRVREMESDKQAWIKNTALARVLAPHLGKGGALAALSTAEQVETLKRYFEAVANVWPNAWGNTREYVLCRSVGFTVLLGLLGAVLRGRGRAVTGRRTAAAFAARLAPLRDAVVALPNGGVLHLDWRPQTSSALSSSATRSHVIHSLARRLSETELGGTTPKTLD